MTTPSQIRSGLTIVTDAAIADLRTVSELPSEPTDIRAALFAAVPLIVGDYIDGSAALAIDWYQELREDADTTRRFTPRPVTFVDPGDIASSVAWATEPLYRLEREFQQLTEELVRQATADSLKLLEPVVQKDVASGFSDTIVTNSAEDDAAQGWRRFARPGACKFCLMLAANGAVYTAETARFASHPNCFCIAGPEFGETQTWVEASRTQYVASRRTRTEKERADLRDYLNTNYPDAPG